ncbi:MAG: hypothetical protein WA061_02105 [Microgenomates group bacterium]
MNERERLKKEERKAERKEKFYEIWRQNRRNFVERIHLQRFNKSSEFCNEFYSRMEYYSDEEMSECYPAEISEMPSYYDYFKWLDGNMEEWDNYHPEPV